MDPSGPNDSRHSQPKIHLMHHQHLCSLVHRGSSSPLSCLHPREDELLQSHWGLTHSCFHWAVFCCALLRALSLLSNTENYSWQGITGDFILGTYLHFAVEALALLKMGRAARLFLTEAVLPLCCHYKCPISWHLASWESCSGFQPAREVLRIGLPVVGRARLLNNTGLEILMQMD